MSRRTRIRTVRSTQQLAQLDVRVGLQKRVARAVIATLVRKSVSGYSQKTRTFILSV